MNKDVTLDTINASTSYREEPLFIHPDQVREFFTFETLSGRMKPPPSDRRCKEMVRMILAAKDHMIDITEGMNGKLARTDMAMSGSVPFNRSFSPEYKCWREWWSHYSERGVYMTLLELTEKLDPTGSFEPENTTVTRVRFFKELR